MKKNANKLQHFSEAFTPLSAEQVLSQISTLREPRVIGDWVLWLEQRPNEGGRTTALIRPWGASDSSGQELTPVPMNLRSRVHSYGGGALASFCEGNKLLLAWINDTDCSLYVQTWKVLAQSKQKQGVWWGSLHSPLSLTCHQDYFLADGLIDSLRRRWIGVMEKNGRDFLVSFALDKEHQQPQVIYRPKDFVGYAVLSPDGDQLAWIEWQAPSMPWDVSQLWVGRFNDAGEIIERQLLAGSTSENLKSKSVFQPIWLPSGELVVAEDSSGWWNLMMLDLKKDSGVAPSWERCWSMESESAMPQWVYGMSTAAAAGKNIVSASCVNGSWQIYVLSRDGLIRTCEQPFDDISGIHAEEERLVAIASNSKKESGLLEVHLSVGSWLHTTVRDPVLEESQISIPEPFCFEGFQGHLTHAWYYPPLNSDRLLPPLLVKIHSGPTGMAGKGLNLGIQFWTSRGWGVVDVNYGGSTGFGRAYRERLKGGWGKVDVFDCAAAARALVSAGKADSQLLAIEGGSAGGYTTLACLCFTDVFRVAACRYAVSDLISMNQETHRFEAGYLDYLLGQWPDERATYLDRSPLQHAEKINCPVIFFQGMKDQVVLPDQTVRIVDVLRNRNIPVEMHTFAEEGHGFRDSRVKIHVLEATEKFFRKHLGI
ncbi:S9 family peptidase [Prochlorococcus sp. MIT 1307]|uniref:S9 family peptidase n=1 Tax=Prochlorococcus sp. MIT 1307 TaxID=3096219 RepID=UPI002A7644B1|nr:prolyl oligopeptidase family serine peptidase [Prochlorococcus sp. MIT 1307]